MMMQINLENVIQDKTSGSLLISQKALSVLRAQIEAHKIEVKDDFVESLAAMGKDMISAHPMLVLVRKRITTVVAYAKRIVKSEKTPEEIKQLLLQKIDELMASAKQIRKKIGEYGAKLIINNNKIITISSSDLLREIFVAAHKAKKKFDVYCLESRPMCEGQQFAEILAKSGISVHVFTDATMGHLIRSANLVLSGTDRYFDTGFINKMGTYPLALAAQKNNVPFYVAGETEKVLKEIDKSVRFQVHDPKEVYKPLHKGVKVSNFYFEMVEYEFVTKIVCEEGIYQTEEFINWYIKD
jgi:translation initiation factor 2B subunit (eIF-2B alpha/beta/delta family)